MNKKTFVISERALATSRLRLPAEVNNVTAKMMDIFNQGHAKVTVSLGVEQPIGPLGNWCQTVTFTVEGDCDDPAFQRVYDAYQRTQMNTRSSGCYVATAVYGSYDCPQVWTLRRYRDNTLAKTWYGRAFIHIYYAVSPTLVKWFGNTEWFRRLWKGRLDHMVANLNASGVEGTPYVDPKW